MAIAFVQCPPQFLAGSNVSTGSVSLTGVGTGNLLVVGIGCQDPQSVSSLGDGTNTYSVYPGLGMQQWTGTSDGCALYYAKNVVGGSLTVTLNLAAVVSDLGIIVCEYSGVDTVSPTDGTGSVNGSTGSLTVDPGSITTGGPNRLIVGLSGFTTQNISAGDATCTVRSNIITDSWTAIEDKIAGAAGSYDATWTAAATSDWIAMIAAFKPAAAPSTGAGQIVSAAAW